MLEQIMKHTVAEYTQLSLTKHTHENKIGILQFFIFHAIRLPEVGHSRVDNSVPY